MRNRLSSFTSFSGPAINAATAVALQNILSVNSPTARSVRSAGGLAIGFSDYRIDWDSDADGLWDDEERALGTDPNHADTDGDGLFDGVDPFPRGGSE